MAAALARESEWLRTPRPRFNRAGTWPGPARFQAWRERDEGLDLASLPEILARTFALNILPEWSYEGRCL